MQGLVQRRTFLFIVNLFSNFSQNSCQVASVWRKISNETRVVKMLNNTICFEKGAFRNLRDGLNEPAVEAC